MKNSRVTESQIVAILKAGEAGVPVAQLVTQSTRHAQQTILLDYAA